MIQARELRRRFSKRFNPKRHDRRHAEWSRRNAKLYTDTLAEEIEAALARTQFPPIVLSPLEVILCGEQISCEVAEAIAWDLTQLRRKPN